MVRVHIKETDLNDPIKAWLELQGCHVNSEVMGIDMMGMYGSECIIAIELKLKLNLEVINQAVERQSISDLVYIAVCHDFKAVETKRFKRTLLTLKRLNLGLLTVNFRAETPIVYEILKPESFDFEKSKRMKLSRRYKVIEEFNKRKSNFNKAGSTRQKIMTGYKEMCLLCAYHIAQNGPCRAKDFEAIEISSKKVSAMFASNHLKWFEKVSRGLYGLSDVGKLALTEYEDVLSFILKEKST